MARSDREICRLCRKTGEPLRNSHIIPEFLHGPLYDAKHRALSIRKGQPGWDLLQKGVRERLLCGDCEHLLNVRYEQPVSKWWTDEYCRGLLAPGSVPIDIRVDYASFKLLHLSIFWRAAVSSLREFRTCSLSRSERERIASKLLSNDPGPTTEDQILGRLVFFPGTRDPARLIVPPIQNVRRGVLVQTAIYGRGAWMMFVGSTPFPEMAPFALKEDGTMVLGAGPFTELNVVDEMYRENVRLTREAEAAGRRRPPGLSAD